MAAKTKTWSRKQFNAWLEARRGWVDDLLADGVTDDLETAAYESAVGLIRFPDLEDGAAEAVAFLRATGVPDLTGCLTDYLYDVARAKE